MLYRFVEVEWDLLCGEDIAEVDFFDFRRLDAGSLYGGCVVG